MLHWAYGDLRSDHPVRSFELCLDLVDWEPWELRYSKLLGQPPIHPRLIASAILYGLILKIRNSRLLEGRTIDHSTLAAFRTAFSKELKDLNRELSRLVCTRFEEALMTLIIDGTRLRANSDRYGACTAQALESLIAACASELERKLQVLGEEDARAEADAQEVKALETEVERLEAEVEKYKRALAVAHERDAPKKPKTARKQRPCGCR